MKKQILMGTLLLGTLFYYGCKKEELNYSNPSNIKASINDPSIQSRFNISNLSEVQLEGDMLVFNDMNHVQNVLSQLESAYHNHEDDFLASYPNKD